MHPLPASLGERFSVASARAAGIPTSRLRRGDLVRPFHGVRERRDAHDDSGSDRFGMPRGDAEAAHLLRARQYAARMAPHEAFSHITAAVIWDIPLPPGVLHDRRVHVGVEGPRRLPRSAGVRGHELLPGITRFATHPTTGLRVTDPASTWATLGAILRSQPDLVAAGDAIVRTWRVPNPLATIDELAVAIDRGRRVGVRSLREALPRLRTRAASRPESHLRLALLDAGLPEPRLNHPIVADGRVVATADLVYPGARVAVEYEGEHHLLDPGQWAYDIERYDALRAAGWTVVRITKADVFGHHAQAAAKVNAALTAR
ncbi:DUF559 domain-containing protein [Microbacterium sp. LMI1x-1-1.1]